MLQMWYKFSGNSDFEPDDSNFASNVSAVELKHLLDWIVAGWDNSVFIFDNYFDKLHKISRLINTNDNLVSFILNDDTSCDEGFSGIVIVDKNTNEALVLGNSFTL